MRFVKARRPDGPRLGVLGADGSTVSIARAGDRLEDYLGDGFSEALHALGESILAAPSGQYELSGLDLVKPVSPSSMRDFMVFEEHVVPSWRASGLRRGPDVWYEQPTGYFSNAANLLGPRDDIEIPGGSRALDFETEVGAVVGRAARSIRPEHAGGHIAGYVVLCDWSARDLQVREMDVHLGPFKGKDFGSSIGPLFVTGDELEGARTATGFDLEMVSMVNGRVYGRDRWASATWSFEELLSYASWNSAVEAGALLGSGTCQGGCILELSLRHGGDQFPWLQPGDEVSLSVELLGDITATVRPPARCAWPGSRAVFGAEPARAQPAL